MTENKGIINLPGVGARVNGVHDIGLSDYNVTSGGSEFFLSAYKFSRAFTDKINLKFAVPVHRDAVEMVGDNTFIIAVWLDFRAVNTVFSGTSLIHANTSESRIVSEYSRISIDFLIIL